MLLFAICLPKVLFAKYFSLSIAKEVNYSLISTFSSLNKKDIDSKLIKESVN